MTFLSYTIANSSVDMEYLQLLKVNLNLSLCLRENFPSGIDFSPIFANSLVSIFASGNRRGKSVFKTSHVMSVNPHGASSLIARKMVNIPVSEGFVSHFRELDIGTALSYYSLEKQRIKPNWVHYPIQMLLVDMEYLLFLLFSFFRK